MSEREQPSQEQSVDEALNVVENYIGRDWMEILTAARTLAAEVKKELARIERDNKTIERGMRRMYDDGYREGYSEGSQERRP